MHVCTCFCESSEELTIANDQELGAHPAHQLALNWREKHGVGASQVG